ncbi:hypothetical protein Esti_005281 [Eimeria stiedai]
MSKDFFLALARDGGGDESGSAAVASLYGSRVSFVFSHVAGDTDVPVGAPGAKAAGRLIDAATAPENVWGGRRDYKDLLALLRGRVFPSFPPLPFVVQDADDLQQQQQHEQQHPVMQLHYRYYITKQIIPALDRLFSLLPPPATADLPQWFREMPKPAHRSLYTPAACSSAPPMQHQQQQEQQQKQQQQQQQQSLLQTLGIKSITAGGAAARERLVLQRFFAAASCILCGSKCRELGPTPLRLCDKNNNSRGFGASGIPKKRRVALRTKGPQATEELALRRGLLMQLHKTSFSSSSSSSSGDEGSRGSVVLKGKRKAERIDVSKEREVTPPPVCEACSSNPAAVYVELQQRLRKIEERIAAARNLCYHCAGSREYAEACLHSWHCDVYFRRISEANKLRILQQQMQNLGLILFALCFSCLLLSSTACLCLPHVAAYQLFSQWLECNSARQHCEASETNGLRAFGFSPSVFSLSDGMQMMGPLQGCLQRGLGRKAPQGDTEGAPDGLLLTKLELLLAKGLNVSVNIQRCQSGLQGAPIKTEEPQLVAALLFMPLVRQARGPPKLRVYVHPEDKGLDDSAALEVHLSSSTVSFVPVSSPEVSQVVQQQGMMRPLNEGHRLPAAATAATAATAAAAATSARRKAGGGGSSYCKAQLLASCGSVISFLGGPWGPMENKVAHDALRVLAAFDFNTIRLHEALRAAVRGGPMSAYFGGLLAGLPLFALGAPPSQLRWVQGHNRMLIACRHTCAAAKENHTAAATTAAAATAAPAPTKDCCPWTPWNSVDLQPVWPVVLACRWLVLIANHEDGVRERHTLLSSFRRLLFILKEKSLIPKPSETDCPSEASSFFIETSVPSDVTAAGTSLCGEFQERCHRPTQEGSFPANPQTSTALNPNAAPFIPRGLSLPGVPPWRARSVCTLAGDHSPSAGAPEGPVPETRAPYESHQPAFPNAFCGALQARDHLRYLKKSASTPKLEGLSTGSDGGPSKGSDGGPQETWEASVMSDAPGGKRPDTLSQSRRLSRSHSAPARRAAAAAAAASAGAEAAEAGAAAATAREVRRYSALSLLASRRPSLSLLPGGWKLGFVKQKQAGDHEQQQQQQPPLVPLSASPTAAAPAEAAAAAATATAAAAAGLLPLSGPPGLRSSSEALSPRGRLFTVQQQAQQPLLLPQKTSIPTEQNGPALRPLFPVQAAQHAGPPLLPTPCGPCISAVSFQHQQRVGDTLPSPFWCPPAALAPVGLRGQLHQGAAWSRCAASPKPAAERNGGAVGEGTPLPPPLPPQRQPNVTPMQGLLPLHGFGTQHQMKQQLQQQQQQLHKQQQQQQRIPCVKAPRRPRAKRAARGGGSTQSGQNYRQQQQQQQQQQQRGGSRLLETPGFLTAPSWPLTLPPGVTLQQLLELVRALLSSSPAIQNMQQQQQQVCML